VDTNPKPKAASVCDVGDVHNPESVRECLSEGDVHNPESVRECLSEGEDNQEKAAE
jgi:hypothetical protein